MPAMRLPRPTLLVALVGLVLVALTGPAAADKAKKYHFTIDQIDVKAVPADKAGDVIEPTKAQLGKAMSAHKQLVASLDGAPDPVTDAKKFKSWLTRKGIAGAFKVNVEVTAFEEELEDKDESLNKEKRLIVRLSLRMFGETIPERKMGFTGDGSSTIKMDVGKKLRPKDRTYAIQQAIELAIDDALATSLKQLAIPPKTPKK